MLRKVYVLGALLVLATSGYSIAAKPDKPSKQDDPASQDKAAKKDNHDKHAADSNKKNSKTKRGSSYAPYFCLQRLWLDYPGDNDLYESASFYNGCDQPPTEELWYGAPVSGNDLPQDCDLCEPGDYRTTHGGPLPPHKLKLNKACACKIIAAGLEAAGTSTSGIKFDFHMIPKDKVPQEVGRDVYIITVQLPPAGSIIEPRYLCLETRQLPTHQLTSEATTFNTVEHRAIAGSQLWIDYTVGTDHRKGFVWLKK
jgi:hypothetical protein